MVIRENFRQTDCIFSLSSMDEEIREEHLANNIYNCRYGRRRERICHGYAQSHKVRIFTTFPANAMGRKRPIYLSLLLQQKSKRGIRRFRMTHRIIKFSMHLCLKISFKWDKMLMHRGFLLIQFEPLKKNPFTVGLICIFHYIHVIIHDLNIPFSVGDKFLSLLVLLF